MADSKTASSEAQLIHALGDLSERIASDETFSGELYRGLANRRWRHAEGEAVSLSWRRAEEVVNGLRAAAGQAPLALTQTGGEGELTGDVEEELSRRGWRSEPLNTGRHHEAHATSPESPPPADAGERLAPTEPPEAARRAHEEADAGERLFPGRPDQSGATAGRDPEERK